MEPPESVHLILGILDNATPADSGKCIGHKVSLLCALPFYSGESEDSCFLCVMYRAIESGFSCTGATVFGQTRSSSRTNWDHVSQ